MRSRLIKEVKVAVSNKFIEVHIGYELGGHSYFTYQVEPRGLYLSATPVEKSEGFRSFTAFSGTKVLYKSTKRFSQKELDNCIPTEQEIDDIVNYVLEKNNLLSYEN